LRARAKFWTPLAQNPGSAPETMKLFSLASQPHSLPQRRSLSVSARADTESDRCCGTEWGWLARLETLDVATEVGRVKGMKMRSIHIRYHTYASKCKCQTNQSKRTARRNLPFCCIPAHDVISSLVTRFDHQLSGNWGGV